MYVCVGMGVRVRVRVRVSASVSVRTRGRVQRSQQLTQSFLYDLQEFSSQAEGEWKSAARAMCQGEMRKQLHEAFQLTVLTHEVNW